MTIKFVKPGPLINRMKNKTLPRFFGSSPAKFAGRWGRIVFLQKKLPIHILELLLRLPDFYSESLLVVTKYVKIFRHATSHAVVVLALWGPLCRTFRRAPVFA